MKDANVVSVVFVPGAGARRVAPDLTPTGGPTTGGEKLAGRAWLANEYPVRGVELSRGKMTAE